MVVIALAIIAAGRSTACRGCRPASCRSRTRATCSPPCSCPTAPRSAAPRRRCSRSPRSPSGRRASTRSSPSPASRRSTTTRRSPMPASPTSCSRTGASAARARISLSLYKTLNEPWRRVEDGARAGAAAAADPGHRQRRRLHHADRAARRQLRPRQAAGRRSTRWCRRRRRSPASSASSAPFRANVPQYTVEVDREKAQTLQLTTDQVFSTLAGYLGSSLCRPVQQVRPRLPGLCPGRRAVPADAGGDRQPHRAQQERRHDPARHRARRSRRASARR